MDFKDALKQLSQRVDKVKDSLQTEEATKTALVMLFLQILGYDVFNPMEVMPEFTCNIGTKKVRRLTKLFSKTASRSFSSRPNIGLKTSTCMTTNC